MNINRILAVLFIVAVGLLLVQTEASATGTARGTAITNRSTVLWNVSGAGQDSTSDQTSSTVRWISSDTMTDPGDQTLNVGETKVYTFTLFNTGNTTESFAISIDSTSLNNGAASWAIYLCVDTKYTNVINDTLFHVSSVAADGIFTCSVAVWAHSTPANAPNGSYADFKLTIRTRYGANADTTMQYTGDNGQVYGAGGYGSIDLSRATVTAPIMMLNKIVDSVAIGLTSSLPLPGATISYGLTYFNNGGAKADSVVIIDTIPTNTKFDSMASSMKNWGATGGAGGFGTDSRTAWLAQASTNSAISHAFTEPSWIDLRNLTAAQVPTVTHVRWIKDSVAAADNGTLKFRVIIQ